MPFHRRLQTAQTGHFGLHLFFRDTVFRPYRRSGGQADTRAHTALRARRYEYLRFNANIRGLLFPHTARQCLRTINFMTGEGHQISLLVPGR